MSYGGRPRGIVVNVFDCDITVSKFGLHSPYYVHFWTNAHGKGMAIPTLLWVK